MKHTLLVLLTFLSFYARSQGRIGADGKLHSTTVGGAFGNLNELDLLSDTTTYKHGMAVLNRLVYVYHTGKWQLSSGVSDTVSTLANYYTKILSDGKYVDRSSMQLISGYKTFDDNVKFNESVTFGRGIITQYVRFLADDGTVTSLYSRGRSPGRSIYMQDKNYTIGDSADATNPANIVQTSNYRFVTDAEKAKVASGTVFPLFQWAGNYDSSKVTPDVLTYFVNGQNSPTKIAFPNANTVPGKLFFVFCDVDNAGFTKMLSSAGGNFLYRGQSLSSMTLRQYQYLSVFSDGTYYRVNDLFEQTATQPWVTSNFQSKENQRLSTTNSPTFVGLRTLGGAVNIFDASNTMGVTINPPSNVGYQHNIILDQPTQRIIMSDGNLDEASFGRGGSGGAVLAGANGLFTFGGNNSANYNVYASEIGTLSGVTSSIQTQLNGKQSTLTSGTTIKTINGTSILGSGDLVVSSSGSYLPLAGGSVIGRLNVVSQFDLGSASSTNFYVGFNRNQSNGAVINNAYKAYTIGEEYGNFYLQRFNSDGSFASNDITINSSTGAATFSGAVISGTGQGFLNSGFQAGYNRIWAFLNSTQYGIGFYQSNDAPNPIRQDAIGFHFGDTTAPKFYVTANGNATLAGNLTASGGITANSNSVINPSGNAAYGEGLRINKHSDKYSVIHLGGEAGSTSGTGAGEWSIARDNGGSLQIYNNAAIVFGIDSATSKAYFSNSLSVGGSFSLNSDHANISDDGSNINISALLGRTLQLNRPDGFVQTGYNTSFAVGNSQQFQVSKTGALSGTTATFMPGVNGPNNGFNVVNGDITTYRSGGSTGAVFLGSNGSNYLYYDGTSYLLGGTSGLTVGGAVRATGYAITGNSDSKFLMAGGGTATVDGTTIINTAGVLSSVGSGGVVAYNIINQTGNSLNYIVSKAAGASQLEQIEVAANMNVVSGSGTAQITVTYRDINLTLRTISIGATMTAAGDYVFPTTSILIYNDHVVDVKLTTTGTINVISAATITHKSFLSSPL